MVFKTSSDVNYSLSSTAALLRSCVTVILKLFCVPTEKLTCPGTTSIPSLGVQLYLISRYPSVMCCYVMSVVCPSVHFK